MLKQCDPSTFSFTWADIDDSAEIEIIKEYPLFTMESSYGHPMLVKPSIEELVEFFPPELFGKVNAVAAINEDIETDYSKGVHLINILPLFIKIIKK